MVSIIKKTSCLVDAAILASLTYGTALALEQVKPGFFSNTIDISAILVVAIVLICLVVLWRPVYKVNRWVVLYYGLWCLALSLLFVKLVQRWLGSSWWLAGGLVVASLGLLAFASRIHQSKEDHG